MVVVLIGFIAAVILAQVFFRKVLNDSLQWSNELAVFFLVWVVFAGAAVVMHRAEHINIPTFVNALPMTVRPYVIIAAKIITLGFLFALAVFGVQVFNGAFHSNAATMPWISTKWVKLAIPLGGATMALFVVTDIARDVVALRRRDRKHFENQGKFSSD